MKFFSNQLSTQKVVILNISNIKHLEKIDKFISFSLNSFLAFNTYIENFLSQHDLILVLQNTSRTLHCTSELSFIAKKRLPILSK